MIVEQVWTGNAYRNFNYVIVCPDTGEALAIDPLDHEKCLSAAEKNGWKITQILNTHEHGDHIGGNEAMVAATGAKLLAHKNAKNKIPGIDIGLGAGPKTNINTRNFVFRIFVGEEFSACSCNHGLVTAYVVAVLVCV